GQMGDQPQTIYQVGLNTTRLLLGLGDLLVGWLLARQADVALARRDELDASDAPKDRSFYTGKLAAARFFAASVLPRLNADRRITEDTTLDVMEIPEEAF